VAAPDLSIIVPTYNRRASLERLLRAIGEQTPPPGGFEVIVIDDGSTDSTMEYLAGFSASFTFRVLKQAHQGPAEARNLGVVNAAAPLVLFLDDDVIPQPDLLLKHIESHTNSEPDTVVIGPMSPPTGWPRAPWVRWEEDKLQRQYDAMMAGLWGATARQFYTGNSSLPRALFIRGGGFDPSFKRAEDVELGYRLRNIGARFVFVASAEVLHHASRTFNAWQRTPRQYGKYDVIMTRDKGHESLALALSEFKTRHVLNRQLSLLVAGRPLLVRAMVALVSLVVHAASSIGAQGVTSRALSGIFNVLYWQGVCDELGGHQALRRSLSSAQPALYLP
jgi:glycosyltransferase involved in cell wall biosynthesis